MSKVISAGTYNVKVTIDADGNAKWYDTNGNHIHSKSSDGYERWSEYSKNNILMHTIVSNGDEIWYTSDGEEITREQYGCTHITC